MLAGGDENLLPGDGIGAVGLRHGLRLEQAEIGAAMRFRQVHGAGPFAGRHVRHVALLLLVAAADDQRGHRAGGEAGIHREGHVGGGHIFADRRRHDMRQALAAELFRDRKALPAAFAISGIGRLEALWRGDAAVRMARAAFAVARHVDRLQHFLGKFRGLVQHRFDGVPRRIGKAR